MLKEEVRLLAAVRGGMVREQAGVDATPVTSQCLVEGRGGIQIRWTASCVRAASRRELERAEAAGAGAGRCVAAGWMRQGQVGGGAPAELESFGFWCGGNAEQCEKSRPASKKV